MRSKNRYTILVIFWDDVSLPENISNMYFSESMITQQFLLKSEFFPVIALLYYIGGVTIQDGAVTVVFLSGLYLIAIFRVPFLMLF